MISCRRVAALAVCTIVLGSVTTRGQGSPAADTAQARFSSVSSALPVPLVTAGVRLPSQTFGWQDVPVVEVCNATFDRLNTSAMVASTRDTLRDTIRYVWRLPPPPAIMTVGRRCLDRFPVATLPVTALGSTLQLAAKLEVDTVVRAIVVRLLSRVPQWQSEGKAAVFDFAITALVQGEEPTGPLQPLMRTYIAQLDSLGATPALLLYRLDARNVLLLQSKDDLDIQRRIRQDIAQLLAPVPPVTATPVNPTHPSNDFKLYTYKLNNAIELAKLNYVHTPSHANLAAVQVAQQQQIDENARMFRAPKEQNVTSVGTQAAPISCGYQYNISVQPSQGGASVPRAGKITVLLLGGEKAPESVLKELRRLAGAALSDIAIITVSQTAGRYANDVFVDHPEQEADRLHQHLADSVRAPGGVCVIHDELQTLPDGHVVVLPAQVLAPYGGKEVVDGNMRLIVVDPTGKIVYAASSDLVARELPEKYDFVEFVRRLHQLFPTPTSSRSQQ